METILGRFRNLIVLAAILFAQIVGLAVQVRRPAQQGDTRLIRIWAVGAITPFEKGVVNTQKFFRDTWHNYVYLRGVRRENRELRAELDRMKLEQVRLKEDAEMARRIQSLLAFKEQHIDTTVAAQVIGTSGSDQSRVLYIDKGSKDGIKTDMAVITPNGIVGKIVQVFPDSAQVLPINDQMSGVGVALKNTRLQGILRGGPNGIATVQYIMADERITPGEDVVTSGGDRIFPKGLPVGKIVDVKPGKDLFLNIRVVPSAQIDRLEEVLVVTRVTEKPPDVQDLGPIRASDILAQRLPTVPDKPQVDANGKPVNGPGTTSAGPNTGGTVPSSVKPPTSTGTPGTATAIPPRVGTAGNTANRTSVAGPGGKPAATAGTGGSSTGGNRSPATAGPTSPGTQSSGPASGSVAQRKTVGADTSATGSASATTSGTSSGSKPRVRVVENDAPVNSPQPTRKPSGAAPPPTQAPPTPPQSGENQPQR